MPSSRIANTPAQAIHTNGTTHQQITVSSTANDIETLGSFTFDNDTTHVVIQVGTAPISVTYDGATTPTTTKGFVYDVGDGAYWSIAMAQNIKMVRQTATDAVVELQELNFASR